MAVANDSRQVVETLWQFRMSFYLRLGHEHFTFWCASCLCPSRTAKSNVFGRSHSDAWAVRVHGILGGTWHTSRGFDFMVYFLGSIVVPFWGSYVESYKAVPKRNYYGAYGLRLLELLIIAM